MKTKKEKHVELSRFLSFLLRHKPDVLSLNVDKSGYVDVKELIEKVNNTKYSIDKNVLDELVFSDSKERYSYDSTEMKIRANQGHSFEVDLGLTEVAPPLILYHGTSELNVQSIKLNGIHKQSRQHVHLSKDPSTALEVGSRRSNPLVLHIDSARMFNDGYKFYLSDNNIWLTDEIPASYILNYK